MTDRDEAQARALFQERYRTTPSLLARQIEQRVIGGDWGANGFTTMGQADTLARELHLSAADVMRQWRAVPEPSARLSHR